MKTRKKIINRRSLRNNGPIRDVRRGMLHCNHPGCRRTWDFASSKSPDFASLRAQYAGKPLTPEMAQWLDEGGASVMSSGDGWGIAFDGSSICNVHNRPVGGFASYTVKCGHPRCRATFKDTFYRPQDDAEGADHSASIEALSQGGWGMAAGKSLRCPAHARIAKKVAISATIAHEFSSEQIVLQNGARIPMPPEYFATVRAMRGKRVKITITIDE